MMKKWHRPFETGHFGPNVNSSGGRPRGPISESAVQQVKKSLTKDAQVNLRSISQHLMPKDLDLL
jgi:hypothetical protein